MADNFVFDNFLDQPDKLPQDVALDKVRNLVSSFGLELRDAERHLSEDLADADRWDIHTDMITVECGKDRVIPTIEDNMGSVVKDNKILHRIIMVLSSLQAEMMNLVTESKQVLIPQLALFGEKSDIKEKMETAEAEELFFPRILPLLMDVWNYRERCTEVVKNAMKQFASIYDEKNRKKGILTPYLSVHFLPIWRSIGDTIATLVCMDEIIRQNDNFVRCGTIFKRMMKNARMQPDKFDTDEARMKRFDALLNTIEHDVLDDRLTEPLLTTSFDGDGLNVHNNNLLHDEMKFAVRDLFRTVTKHLGTTLEMDSREQVIGLFSLCLLYFRIFQERAKKDADCKKLFKDLFDVHKKVAVVHISGAYYWQLAISLAQRLPLLTNSICKDPTKENLSNLRSQCKALEDSLDTQVNMFTTQGNIWLAQMQSSFPMNGPLAKENVSRFSHYIYKGLALAYEMNTFLKNAFGLLTLAKEAGVTVKKLSSLCQIIHLLMVIREAFHNRTSVFGSIHSLCCETIAYNFQKQLYAIRSKFIENQSRFDDQQTDQLSALDLMSHLMNLPYTKLSFSIMEIAMSVGLQRAAPFTTEDKFDQMRMDFSVLRRLSNIQELYEEATDVSYLYWYRELMWATQLKRIFDQPALAMELPYILMAAQDPIPMLYCAKHCKSFDSLALAYKKEITDIVEGTIITPLCREVENFLRLHIHSVILGQPYHVIDTQPKDYSRVLRIGPIRLFDEIILIRDHVQNYLEAQFYNLTALQTHDWKTYEEMRALAKEIFDITLTESHLPGHIVDQGLDVLVITRRIADFVSRYTYNMNNQMFIERPNVTDSKHVHTLQIRHIANSIRTHGTGIMNTTVNFVYQFLTRRLSLVSQFLYDDHVKSRLIKDARYFSEIRASVNNYYPLPRAEKFCVDIRKLGLLEDGKSYLDQFRQLVTEIGNVLGYVRMMRSGGLRSVSEAAVFVPDIDNVPQFGPLLEGKKPKPKKPKDEKKPHGEDEDEPEDDEQDLEGMEDEEDENAVPIAAPTTIAAGQALDGVLENITRRLSDESDFFKTIFQTFEENVNNEKNAHLKNFFMLVPPLTLSYIEHISACKEKLLKKGKEALFTDDGFALGVVFLLTLLHSNGEFDSLHWFPSIVKTYIEERRELLNLVKSKTTTKKGAEEVKTAPLTLNKIETHLKEISLLEATFRSARVFFKEKGTSVMDDEEGGEGEGGEA
eukprot:PhF_6_TR36555/c0_g1_i2/m.53955/K18465/MRT43, SWIP; WASH complex subunit 7